MKESKFKIILFFLVSLIVISILISNIGQNFKGNISSYDFTAKYMNNLKKISSKSKAYQQYINFSASYISKFMRTNNFDSYSDDKYMDEWKVNIPSIQYPSSLEVIKNNRVLKRYQYGTDFFEDFRGNITTGIVKSKADYAENLSSIHNVLKEILLYDGYKDNTTPGAITYTDDKLRSLGASGIISPCYNQDFINTSGYNDKYPYESKNSNGIAKLITTTTVFDELKDFSEKGYSIKIKSGGAIKPFVYKNIYGIIKGAKPKYKPLVISTFYDGVINSNNNKFSISKNYQLTSSILMDCMRVVNKQRLRKPDRTIIFAFLSGYNKDEEGLSHFIRKNQDSNVLILNGLGLSDNYNILYSKNENNLSINASNLMKTNNFNIIYRKIDQTMNYNTLLLSASNIENMNEISVPNYYRVYSSSKFILSLIEDECYNVNLLTGNIRHFKLFEKFVRNHSALLSIIAIILLVLALFVPTKKHHRDKL